MLAIVLLGAKGKALFGPEGFELFERKIFTEPATHTLAINGFVAFAGCKFLCHIGGLSQVVFMAHHQHTVFARDHIGLDKICTFADRLLVSRQGMFGQEPTGAPVGNDQRHAIRGCAQKGPSCSRRREKQQRSRQGQKGFEQ